MVYKYITICNTFFVDIMYLKPLNPAGRKCKCEFGVGHSILVGVTQITAAEIALPPLHVLPLLADD